MEEALVNIIYILRSMNERISNLEEHSSMDTNYRIEIRNILDDIKKKLIDKY